MTSSTEPSVKDDIDIPMRKTIAMLNLWGIPTKWSCCGFDFPEQPAWASHSYGTAYIRTKSNGVIFEKIARLFNIPLFAQGMWRGYIMSYPHQNETDITMSCTIGGGQWTQKDCVHFYEHLLTRIKYLEDRLLEFKDEFVDVVTLHDFNHDMKVNLPGWQFEPKGDWEIIKDQILV